MRKILALVFCIGLLTTGAAAAKPSVGEDAWVTPVGALEERTEETGLPVAVPTSAGYTDAEINMIANVVNGEVGGIGGASVVLTYADGSQLWTDGNTIRMIHARIVDNQVRSPMFPSTVQGCVSQCWSWSYTGTAWRDSAQWQSCREAVEDALAGSGIVPTNVYAATCDGAFSSYYPGWHLWARVDWNTGWYSGTFYYYAYG